MRLMIYIIHVITAICVTCFLQVFFHEVGHMLFGYFSGWRHIYLQIFKFILIKKRKTFGIKVVTTSGCRCIMYPKNINNGALVYTLGGLIMNTILTSCGILGIVCFYNYPLIMIYSLSLCTSGLAIILANGLPNTKFICNDMACLIFMKRDSLSRECHNHQLMIAKHLYEGETYRQIGKKLICHTGSQVVNDITAYHAVLECYYFLDNDEYKNAQNSLLKIDMSAPISKGVKDIIQMEMLYIDMLLDLLLQKTAKLQKACYCSEMAGYIKEFEIRGDVQSDRVKATYEAYIRYTHGDTDEAMAGLKSSISEMARRSYLYPGEVLFCIDQLSGLYNLLWRDKNRTLIV